LAQEKKKKENLKNNQKALFLIQEKKEKNLTLSQVSMIKLFNDQLLTQPSTKKKTKRPWIWTLFFQDRKPQNDWGSKGRPKKKRKKKSQKTIKKPCFHLEKKTKQFDLITGINDQTFQ
jgi:hypothetical protein